MTIKQMTEDTFINLKHAMRIYKRSYQYEGKNQRYINIVFVDGKEATYYNEHLFYKNGEDFDMFFDNLIAYWIASVHN